MFDRFFYDLSLRAKSKLGVSGEVVGCLVLGALLAVIALIFLSLAAYTWLASLFGGAIAWLIVGGVHLIIAGAAIARGIAVNKRIRAVARAQLELSTKGRTQSNWKLDPTYMAIGLEVAKIVGIRTILPLVASGIAAAGVSWANSRRKSRWKPGR